MKSDWLEKRKDGIGGSDAPAVCGVSPWKTAYDVWREKIGEAEPQIDNDAMYWGRALEPLIRQRYADETGRTVIVPQDIIVHPKIPWCIATLDGMTKDRVVEIKTARTAQGWGEPGSSDIPEVYLVQIMHYLTVTRMQYADVAALIGGNDFRIYTIEADPSLQEMILNREAEFWDAVERKDPPTPVTYSDLRQRYKSSKAITKQTTAEVNAAIMRIKQIQELTKEEDKQKAIIMAHLKEADTLIDGDRILATWRTSKAAKRFDAKKLLEKMPDIYNAFMTEGDPSRKLLIK